MGGAVSSLLRRRLVAGLCALVAMLGVWAATGAIDWWLREGGRLLIDGTLVVYCFDARDGKEVWKYDVTAKAGGENIRWESAQSPIIDGDIVLLAGGGRKG